MIPTVHHLVFNCNIQSQGKGNRREKRFDGRIERAGVRSDARIGLENQTRLSTERDQLRMSRSVSSPHMLRDR